MFVSYNVYWFILGEGDGIEICFVDYLVDETLSVLIVLLRVSGSLVSNK